MRTSRFTPEQMVMALRQSESGTPVEEACRMVGISEATFQWWKKRGVAEVRQLRQLHEENRRLKTVVAGLTPDWSILQEAPRRTGEAGATKDRGQLGAAGLPAVRARSLQCDRGLAIVDPVPQRPA